MFYRLMNEDLQLFLHVCKGQDGKLGSGRERDVADRFYDSPP